MNQAADPRIVIVNCDMSASPAGVNESALKKFRGKLARVGTPVQGRCDLREQPATNALKSSLPENEESRMDMDNRAPPCRLCGASAVVEIEGRDGALEPLCYADLPPLAQEIYDALITAGWEPPWSPTKQ
jgi:hypothetical protein